MALEKKKKKWWLINHWKCSFFCYCLVNVKVSQDATKGLHMDHHHHPPQISEKVMKVLFPLQELVWYLSQPLMSANFKNSPWIWRPRWNTSLWYLHQCHYISCFCCCSAIQSSCTSFCTLLILPGDKAIQTLLGFLNRICSLLLFLGPAPSFWAGFMMKWASFQSETYLQHNLIPQLVSFNNSN